MFLGCEVQRCSSTSLGRWPEGAVDGLVEWFDIAGFYRAVLAAQGVVR